MSDGNYSNRQDWATKNTSNNSSNNTNNIRSLYKRWPLKSSAFGNNSNNNNDNNKSNSSNCEIENWPVCYVSCTIPLARLSWLATKVQVIIIMSGKITSRKHASVKHNGCWSFCFCYFENQTFSERIWTEIWPLHCLMSAWYGHNTHFERS